MNGQNITIGVVGLISVVALIFSFGGGETVREVVREKPSVGGIGGEVNSYLRVGGWFQQGGQIRATSTVNSAETLLATDMLEYDIIDVTPNSGNLTLTLPATTTFPTIANPGDYRTWVIRNAATAATTTTIAAGTGVDLQEPDGQNVVIGQNNYAWLTCYRKADTDITCLVDESIPAD